MLKKSYSLKQKTKAPTKNQSNKKPQNQTQDHLKNRDLDNVFHIFGSTVLAVRKCQIP